MFHLYPPKPDIRDVPSFLNQDWEAGLFDFGKAKVKGVDYFNCGFVTRPDGDWLITRRAIWDKRDEFGYNDIMAFSLKGLTPQMGYKVHMGQQFLDEHFEDPRAVYNESDGLTYISACNFVRNKRGMVYPHQCVSAVDNDWKLVKRYDPVYGFNGNDVGKNTKHEKNFLWSKIPNGWLMVYKASPHTVAIFDANFKLVTDTISPWNDSIWEYGQVRGGTPAVLVGGEYFTFFHSSTKLNETKNQYHCGCYSFESKPPFKITGITTKPLLSGSKEDGGFPDKPSCIYPCGSKLIGNEWLITMGVNDLKCGWFKIPHKNLTKLLNHECARPNWPEIRKIDSVEAG